MPEPSNGPRWPYTNLILGASLSLLVGTLVASLTWWRDYAVRSQLQDQQVVQVRELGERMNRAFDLIHAMQQVDQDQSHDLRDLDATLVMHRHNLDEILTRLRVLESRAWGPPPMPK